MWFISKKDKEQVKINRQLQKFCGSLPYKRHRKGFFFWYKQKVPKLFFHPRKFLVWLSPWGPNTLLRKRRAQDSTLDCLFQHLTLGRLQADHSSHLPSWIIFLCKHQLRSFQNPVMITLEPAGLPLGTHMLLWETTNFLLAQAAMKMSPVLDHSMTLHVTAWARLPAQNSWQYTLRYADLAGPFSEDKSHWSFTPYIALWHHHEPEQNTWMTKVPERGSHCLHFHRLNISTQLSTRSLKWW